MFDGLLVFHRSLRSPASIIQLAIYLAAAVLAGYQHAATFSESHFIPSILTLATSILALEFGISAARQDSQPPRYRWILHAGAGFLALFFFYHILINIQSESVLGPFTIRALIGGAGLATLVYWLVFAPALHLNHEFPEWTTWLWEGMIALVILQISLELGTTLRPMATAAFGLAVLLMVLRFRWPQRLVIHSWMLFIASGLQLIYVLALWPELTKQWWTSSTAFGWCTLAIQVLQVAVTHRSRIWLISAQDWKFRWLPKNFANGIARWHNWLNFYPVILFAALYFYWHFDRAVLTMLWFLEVFVVFILGLFIRDRHFVRISYFFLAFCAARLLFFDLAQSDLMVRAAVFVFCGLLMLGINALQRKFQHRLTSNEEIS